MPFTQNWLVFACGSAVSLLTARSLLDRWPCMPMAHAVCKNPSCCAKSLQIFNSMMTALLSIYGHLLLYCCVLLKWNACLGMAIAVCRLQRQQLCIDPLGPSCFLEDRAGDARKLGTNKQMPKANGMLQASLLWLCLLPCHMRGCNRSGNGMMTICARACTKAVCQRLFVS